MNVVELTGQSLHLADQNRKCLQGLLLNILWLVAVFGSCFSSAKTVTLECQRNDSTQITCQRTITGISGSTTDRIPGQLQKATYNKADGLGVLLATTTGKMELVPHDIKFMNKQKETADRLNNFLKDPQQATIRVEQNNNLLLNHPFVPFMLLAYLGNFSYFLAIPLKVSCKFDRFSDKVTITKKYLYGERQTIWPLSTTQQAQIHQCLLYINHRANYQIELIQLNGKTISFAFPSHDLEQYKAIVNTTNDFLKSSTSKSDGIWG
jgi:hypothetical protein